MTHTRATSARAAPAGHAGGQWTARVASSRPMPTVREQIVTDLEHATLAEGEYEAETRAAITAIEAELGPSAGQRL